MRGFRIYVWFILALSIVSLSVCFVEFMEWGGVLSHLLFLDILAYSLLIPCVYFLVRSSQRKAFRPGLWGYVHAVPFVTCVILLMPLYVVDGIQKLHFSTSPPVIVTMAESIVVGQGLFYAVFFLLKKARGRAGKSGYLTLVVLLYTVFYSLGVYFGSTWLHFTGLVVINIFAFRFWFMLTSSGKDSGKSSGNCSLAEQLEKSMAQDKLYLQPDMSLARLALYVGSTTNKVSGVLNTQLSLGFNEWLNGYRVNEAIRLIDTRANDLYTLEAISEMAGFRSLTTFNKAFKKHTGKTPSQFKN